MVKQPDRLKKRSQFLHVAHKGHKIVTPGLIAQVLPGQADEDLRVGFTVTKKVGNSVVRNRVRRRLREAVRLSYKEQKNKEEKSPFSGDIVVIGRAATLKRPFHKIKKDVLLILKNESKDFEKGRSHSNRGSYKRRRNP